MERERLVSPFPFIVTNKVKNIDKKLFFEIVLCIVKIYYDR
jgi:hypothetical protein